MIVPYVHPLRQRPVRPSFAPTPVVHPSDTRQRLGARGGSSLQLPQDHIVAGRDSEACRQHLAWTTAGGVAEQPQELDDAVGSPCHGCREGGQTFYKGLPLAPTIAASPPADPKLQRHPLALNRQILQPPVVPAVKRLRVLTAVRTPLISFTDRRDQPATINLLGTDDTHVGPKGPMTRLFHIAKIVGDRRCSTRLYGELHRLWR
jgi:hypothetical protein